MPYNLFVVADLKSSGDLASAIGALGRWHQFQRTLYYVNTPHDVREVLHRLSGVLADGDRVAVINAASGFVMTWDPAIAAQIAARTGAEPTHQQTGAMEVGRCVPSVARRTHPPPRRPPPV